MQWSITGHSASGATGKREESLGDKWLFFTLKWQSQLARIKLAEPCLPRMSSRGRGDFAVDLKELTVLVRMPVENKPNLNRI